MTCAVPGTSKPSGPGGRAKAGEAVTAVLFIFADPRRALCLAAGVLSASVCLDALSDPDVWWHIRLGSWILEHRAVPHQELFSYTAAGRPLTAHEWLADAAFAALFGAGGLLLLSLVAAAVSWSGLVALALRARARGAGPLAIALGLLIGAKTASVVLGTRPQVVTFALTCWVLAIVERHLARGGRQRWLMVPLFLLWANLHAGFLGGLLLATLAVGAEALKRWLGIEPAASRRRIQELGVALGASALAACANPAGPGLYRFAILVSATESRKPIAEWQSPDFHQPGALLLLVLIVTIVLGAGLGSSLDLRDAILAITGTALVLVAVRNTAIFVAAVLPAWIVMAERAGVLLRSRRHRPLGLRPRVRVTPLAVVAGMVIVASGAAVTSQAVARAADDASPHGIAATYPACAADRLAHASGAVRIFVGYDAAGYIIHRLWPKARVYEYGESISLGDTVFANYLRVVAAEAVPPTADSLLDSSGTNAVLVSPSPLDEHLATSPGWRLVLRDGRRDLYVRAGSDQILGAGSC